ncbi:BMP family ABC transporter substrate-binding protein [Alkaliphilus sp. B6464]|uniref:BMP family ABC transporter substrate-binding protein n=1 Tax=Alkaliphilus sp. B6464 TaxID=2731219 RepID=UPI001BA8AD4B|nr:BMP family ABC transporter substrate-binding protein [Alkaliphilus sp. B6464]QUH19316.1 BMP family ABC transporter substrate-binding protein [Alkaliphilus sp. B6464]
MKKSVSILLALLLAISLVLVGCGSKTGAPAGNNEQQEDTLKVALLINGSLGDKSFFDSADNGMKLLKEKYGDKVETKTIEMGKDLTKWEPTLQDVSEQDWDIIIVGTWQMSEPLSNIAPQYPDKKYIIFDTEVDYSTGDFSNVYSVLYKQNEVAFLAGALASKVTTSDMPLANEQKLIGFLGGVDVPVVNDFLVGYIEGAQYVNEDVKVALSYVGAFSDSAKAKEMSLAQYNQGVDIAFNVAGQGGLGQIDAAKETNNYVIGVDSDQAHLFKDSDIDKAKLITTSALKRVDNSIVRAVEMYKEGTLKFGETEVTGFKEECVGLAENEIYTEVVPEEIRKELSEIKEKLINGEIKVKTAMGMSTEELNQIRDSVRP